MNVIDIFSGSGGLSLGFGQAGFETTDAADSDDAAAATFQANHPSARVFVGDVADFLQETSLISPSVLIGGPPCQGFSAINPSRRLDDPRNTGVDLFVLALKKFRPPISVMENVPGLLSLGRGGAFKSVVNAMTELGYNVQFKVLQAAHYGVPQSRWRLFIVASRPGIDFSFPEPTHAADIRPNFPGGSRFSLSVRTDDLFSQLETCATVWEAMSDLPALSNGGNNNTKYRCPPESEYQKLLRRHSDQLSNHCCNKLGPLQMQRVRAIRGEGANWKSLPDDLIPENLKRMKVRYGDGLGCNQRFGRLSKSGMFSAILTTPHLYWGAFIHPTDDRVISVREAARAQSFPDAYVFRGRLSKQYEQVGNAVPPLLSNAIAISVSKSLQ